MNIIIKWTSGVLLFILVVLAALVAPIDFTVLEQQPFYHRMMEKLDTFKLKTFEPTKPLQIGWSQFSIVPDQPRPLAGYKPRANFESVHDTIYARVMSIHNGAVSAYLISVDLLLFPPELKKLVLNKFQSPEPSFLYFSASHTHTGVGGWDPTLLGNILMGAYQKKWTEELADKIIDHMVKAKASEKPAILGHWEADGKRHAVHRIDKKGTSEIDGTIRGISAVRSDSTKGILFTYSVHPTLISRRGTAISGDYPGIALATLKEKYQYTQFMAGMMGSHGIRGFDLYDFPLVDSIGHSVAHLIEKATPVPEDSLVQIRTGKIEIEHGPSQLRLTKKLKLRNWVFESVIQPLRSEFDVLKIGDILFLGTSCDFSGEINVTSHLEEKALALKEHLIITSFNGNYTGYITADKHYLISSHEEVRGLNWVGPYYGKYYTDMIDRIIEIAAE